MKKLLKLVLITLFFTSMLQAQNNDIKLIIRGDDIGSSHAANVGCIESYQNGIMTSVEIMPPCPWFYGAVKMLKENPDLDVGIHLTLTAEWDYIKWRPITNCSSITDEDGNFFPMVWKNEMYPPHNSIAESEWNLDEIEKELRAQIEITMKHLPQASHITTHMGFNKLDPKIENLLENLAKEYGLFVDMSEVKRFRAWNGELPLETRIDQFCENLEKLTPGTYLFVEHPAKDFPEMQPVGHPRNRNVAEQRNMVTKVFTNEKVKKTIQQKGIQLISYGDYKNLN